MSVSIPTLDSRGFGYISYLPLFGPYYIQYIPFHRDAVPVEAGVSNTVEVILREEGTIDRDASLYNLYSQDARPR